jgi:hypothetical protein
MLTNDQQAQLDDAFARVGKPSVALQLKIDQLRAAKTEGEVLNVLFQNADVGRSKNENDLLCLVALTKQLELRENQQHEQFERTEKMEIRKPTLLSKENRKPQPEQSTFFNLVKAVGIIVLMFFGGVALLSALFDKKHTGPAIEYTILSTTVNGQYFEKEETAADLASDYVTFSDGTRVPWTAVKITRAKFYPDELGTKTNSP